LELPEPLAVNAGILSKSEQHPVETSLPDHAAQGNAKRYRWRVEPCSLSTPRIENAVVHSMLPVNRTTAQRPNSRVLRPIEDSGISGRRQGCLVDLAAKEAARLLDLETDHLGLATVGQPKLTALVVMRPEG
jgi:hypothetical protein